MRVILGLGSNKGDSAAILDGALSDLRRILGSLKTASLYKTRPLHIEDQPAFLNTACAGSFDGAPRKLLSEIHAIEARFGRDRRRELRWGERTLDIDILLAENLILTEVDLEIPHPRLTSRRFALEPLLELEPGATLPQTGERLRSICDRLPGQGVELLCPQ